MLINCDLLLYVFDFAFEVDDFLIAFVLIELKGADEVSLEDSLNLHNGARLIHSAETAERHHVFDVVFAGLFGLLIDRVNQVEALMILHDSEDGHGFIQKLFDPIAPLIRRTD